MQKVYIDETYQASIVCPKCGLNKKNIDVTNFKDTHKILKAKCRCGEVFRFTLEYRKHFHKDVRLAVKYLVQRKGDREEILVEDISPNGIRFSSLLPRNISRDDIVELKFRLDNPMRKEIKVLVKILCAKDHNVGAK